MSRHWTPPAHGTTARYRSRVDPCRCDLCRNAWNAYMTHYRTRNGLR